jgi:hypothetical protein
MNEKPQLNEMQRVFAEWPSGIPRNGIMLTTFGESIPFVSYMIRGDLLLVERKTPDALGARRVIMRFESVAAVKILDAIEMPRFESMGFHVPMSADTTAPTRQR